MINELRTFQNFYMDEPMNQENFIKVKINSTEPDKLVVEGRTPSMAKLTIAHPQTFRITPAGTLYDKPFANVDGGPKAQSSQTTLIASPTRKLEPVPLKQLQFQKEVK